MGSLAGKDSSSASSSALLAFLLSGDSVARRVGISIPFVDGEGYKKMGACTTRPHLYVSIYLTALLGAADVVIAIGRRAALLTASLFAGLVLLGIRTLRVLLTLLGLRSLVASAAHLVGVALGVARLIALRALLALLTLLILVLILLALILTGLALLLLLALIFVVLVLRHFSKSPDFT